MSSVASLRAQMAARLVEAGAWEADEDFGRIVRCVTGGDWSDESALGERALAQVEALVRRREQREPIEYITGTALFGGIEIAVGPGVFIPRRHTEPLLAWALDQLRGRDRPIVVDLCAGSGAVGLAIAHQRPDAEVHAVEAGPAAINWLEKNQRRRESCGDTALHLHHQDVAWSIPNIPGASVDLIVANPPFVPNGRDLPAEWQEHQPHEALFGGDDGLHVVHAVIARAIELLKPGGSIAIEHDDDQGPRIAALLGADRHFDDICVRRDHRGDPRYTTAIRANDERSSL